MLSFLNVVLPKVVPDLWFKYLAFNSTHHKTPGGNAAAPTQALLNPVGSFGLGGPPQYKGIFLPLPGSKHLKAQWVNLDLPQLYICHKFVSTWQDESDLENKSGFGMCHCHQIHLFPGLSPPVLHTSLFCPLLNLQLLRLNNQSWLLAQLKALCIIIFANNS